MISTNCCTVCKMACVTSILVFDIIYCLLFMMLCLRGFHRIEDPPENDSICKVYDDVTCANGGLLQYTEDTGFVCKCTPEYYGENCTEEVKKWPIISWIIREITNTDIDRRQGNPTMWWSFLPFTTDLQIKKIYSFHQNQVMRLEMFSTVNRDHIESSENNMMSTRILPPARPMHCPNKNLPPLSLLYYQIFQRTPGNLFEPEPISRNLLFRAFHQYFMLQFFNSDFSMTVTASQLYGTDIKTQSELRQFKDGKMKTENVNNEQFQRIAPCLFNTQDQKWPMDHPLTSTNPMLLVISTLWVREHNRVCDLLKLKWPTWTDDQIFNTAKSTVIGEMMNIMMTDIIDVHMAHSFSLKLKPELFHDQLKNISGFNTPFELLLTSMWSSLPNRLNDVPMDTMLFSGNSQRVSDGLSKAVQHMMSKKMGSDTYNNHGSATKPLIYLIMNLSRQSAIQSFNNYRRQFGLYAYNSFFELTNNWDIANKLKKLYNNIEDVELLTGLLIEKRYIGVVPTATIMTNSFIINSILTNPITMKHLWKQETFGGDEGFNIVKNANIETFICNNLADKCNDLKKILHANQMH